MIDRLAVTNLNFLESMFEDAGPGTHTVVCSFPGDPNGGERFKWAGRAWAPGVPWNPIIRVGETDTTTGEIRWPAHVFDDGNTYTTISTFDPDPETGKRRRRKELFSSLSAVMIDDIGTKVDAARLRLEPSALVETSPGNYQAYLFVRQDADSRDRATCEALIDAMVAKGLTTTGADPGMKGVTRYGRLPVGVNGKAKYVAQLGAPFVVRCRSFDPMRRYTVQEIAGAWNLILTKRDVESRQPITLTPEQLAAAESQFSALVEVFKAIGLYRGKSRSGQWHDIICPWVHEHTDRAESGTAISEPAPDNNYACGFRCHHAHGEHLHMRDVRAFIRSLMQQLRTQASA